MSFYLTNPDYTPYQCTECDEECDPLETSEHIVDGKSVCSECVLSCYDCGELLTDENKDSGPLVMVRRWELNGKRKPSHAACAAEEMCLEVAA